MAAHSELKLEQFHMSLCRPREQGCSGEVPGHGLPQHIPQREPYFTSQLQAKFEHLKRVHQEEKLRLEEKRRLLEEEIIAFSKKKATSEIYQSQPFMTPGGNVRKDKDRKK